jgi:hypothetical protein
MYEIQLAYFGTPMTRRVRNCSFPDKAGFSKNDENPILMRVTELYYPFMYESLPSATPPACFLICPFLMEGIISACPFLLDYYTVNRGQPALFLQL